ncbi:MAG: SDR family NAD(P)-dependent oxidoreductase, partial [Cytophagaceae bacterium]
MDKLLKDRVAVVCGSTAGIGKAIAFDFARLGARVIVLARNEEKLRNVIKELKSFSEEEHDFLQVDFSDTQIFENRIKQFFNQIPKVDILVNNTGGPPAGTAFEADVSEFTSAFNNHLVCNHYLMQTLVPGMRKN